jgi:hypothetical protein
MDMGVSVFNVSLGNMSPYSLAKCKVTSHCRSWPPFGPHAQHLGDITPSLGKDIALSFLYAFAHKVSSCSTTLTTDETRMLQNHTS